jgi:DNA-binding transcriptional LysR family regulator
MKRLTLRHLQALQVISASGSLVAAAARMNITPSALTARVKALEDLLGVTLFDRTASGLRPNMAGEIALGEAKRIGDALRLFEDRMEAVRTGRAGRLSIGVVSTAKYFAPRLVAAFVKQYPDLEIRLLIGNRGETVAWLKSFEIDVLLAGRPPADLPMANITIGPHPYVIIAPPFHRLAGLSAVPKETLGGEPFLFREEGSGSRAMFEYFMGDIAIHRARIGIELGSNESIKQAVIAGLGIALISAHTVAAEIADGRLTCLDVIGLPIVRQWQIVHRTDRELSTAARSFRDFAEQRCASFLPQVAAPGARRIPQAPDLA